jgi:hypothetical protein
MSKGERIIIFVTTMVLLAIVYGLFRNSITSLGDRGVVIFSALIMLSFVTLLAEHFFARPTDIVASTLSVLLLISPLHALLKETGGWFWAIWIYSASLLVLSLLSLLLIDKNKSPAATSNRLSGVLYRVSTVFGSGRLVWFAVFIVTTLFYVDNQSPLFVALLIYTAFILIVDPSKLFRLFRIPRPKSSHAVAEIFSVQSDSGFLARTFPGAPTVKRFDIVGFSAKAVAAGAWKTGLVLDAYQLNQQR